MSYNASFLDDLNEIIELIAANKVNGPNEAIEKFTIYLNSIQQIGPFNSNDWPAEWRKRTWKLGEEFKTRNPLQFINIINGIFNSATSSNKEVLEFIRSEIEFNFLPDFERKKKLDKLIENYPYNPEFRYTLGHCFLLDKKVLEAINEYKTAYKIDHTNEKFLDSRFKHDQLYLNEFIMTGELDAGKKYLLAILDDEEYMNAGTNIRPSFIDFYRRFDDHIVFQSKLQKLESDFKEKIEIDFANERKRIIEIVGFFSAIIAFILATVSIGKNFSFLEAIYFLITLGITLIIFSISLSLVFSSSKTRLINDKKFWILISALILMFVFIILSNSIAKMLTFYIR